MYHALLDTVLIPSAPHRVCPVHLANFLKALEILTVLCVLQIRISDHPVPASVNHVAKVMAPKILELPNVKSVVLVKCHRFVLTMESRAVCYVLLEQINH